MRILALILVAHCVATIQVCAQKIAVAERHVVLVCGNGEVYCRGDNNGGALGDGTTNKQLEFVRAEGLEGVRSVAVNESGTFAVTQRGEVYFWGDILGSYLGFPSWSNPQYAPLLLKTVDSVVQVAPGGMHVLYLRIDGSVVATGVNSSGTYGNGTTESLDTGYAVTHVDSVASVCTGRATCFAVQRNGVVKAWGTNYDNSIDSTQIKKYIEPIAIQGIQPTSSLAVAWSNDLNASVIQVSEGGDVYHWNSSERIDFPAECTKVVSSPDHSLALLRDGSVWSWDDSSVEPIRVLPLANIIDIAAGPRVSLALDSDGRLFGWGYNGFHQISSDTIRWYSSPFQMLLPCAVTTVAQEPTAPLLAKVFPIPCNEYFNVELTQDQVGRYIEARVYALGGEVLYVSSGYYDRGMRLPIHNLSSGVYILVVTSSVGSQSLMFVKK